MKTNNGTPVYLKTDDNMPWPEDKFFYLLARDGLFLCRNHEFFASSTKVEKGPKDLASHSESLHLSYPKIPQAILERAVGFFQLVVDKQNSEAAVVVAWNRNTNQVELVIPDQIGVNSGYSSAGSPHGYPMDVKYDIPTFPPNLALIGDIHCHVDGSACASYTDEHDEVHRPGIHIVVGHIGEEPPQFHIEAVADGKRFDVKDLKLVCEGYHKRRMEEVPLDWLDKVKLEKKTYESVGYSGGGYTGGYYGGYGGTTYINPSPNKDLFESDRKIVKRILEAHSKHDTCPTYEELRGDLWRGTKMATYQWCEEKARKFIKAWPLIKKGRKEKKAA